MLILCEARYVDSMQGKVSILHKSKVNAYEKIMVMVKGNRTKKIIFLKKIKVKIFKNNSDTPSKNKTTDYLFKAFLSVFLEVIVLTQSGSLFQHSPP